VRTHLPSARKGFWEKQRGTPEMAWGADEGAGENLGIGEKGSKEPRKREKESLSRGVKGLGVRDQAASCQQRGETDLIPENLAKKGPDSRKRKRYGNLAAKKKIKKSQGEILCQKKNSEGRVKRSLQRRVEGSEVWGGKIKIWRREGNKKKGT